MRVLVPARCRDVGVCWCYIQPKGSKHASRSTDARATTHPRTDQKPFRTCPKTDRGPGLCWKVRQFSKEQHQHPTADTTTMTRYSNDGVAASTRHRDAARLEVDRTMICPAEKSKSIKGREIDADVDWEEIRMHEKKNREEEESHSWPSWTGRARHLNSLWCYATTTLDRYLASIATRKGVCYALQ